MISHYLKPYWRNFKKSFLSLSFGIGGFALGMAVFTLCLLFIDRHLITFENSGKIVLSDDVPFSEYEKVGVFGLERIRRFNSDNFGYLEKHREVFASREP